MDDSRYHMWRAMVSLTNVDHKIDELEVETLQNYFSKINATDEQLQQLNSDLNSPPDLNGMLTMITEKKHRSQLVYYARVLFHSDGDFHPEEERVLNTLHGDAMSKVDLEKSLKEVEAVTKEFWERHKAHEAEKNWRQKLVEAVMFWDEKN